ncbi:uncharacterized protein BDCG_00545 [Blastomyces dermatitidis ER-3]|uniref:Uncharacterized protein n=2 Tax=Blastomyces TaxID=229219 RepID=A0A179UL13_BLAGS|nr:uncharacterized protein BDBG_04992 [Blastomyces gilchristii SLH14081]XP_045271866.1 uncharacterized protein BDCG_00545 [Blastomyces dermatitidis ER-3]EEQ83740.2 hypothetical protein BDCG_00545 [Blastomyces dermatitidis ER-3]OAT08755.1 hypothetical protein BDBG_04992 [Blastomyces gilchristii SLH14081]
MTPAVMLRISTVTPGAPRGPWLKNCAKTILAQTTPSWTSMGTFLKSPPADGTASQTKDAAFELPGPCTLSPLGKILFVQVSYRPNKFYKSYGLKEWHSRLHNILKGKKKALPKETPIIMSPLAFIQS